MHRAMKLSGVLIAIALAGAACGGSDTDTGTDPGDDGTVVGTYVLATVNGTKPPAVYHTDASTILKIDTATLRLVANNTYSDNRTTTLTDITGIHTNTNTRTGTYTSTESTVTLAFTNDLGIPATRALARSGRTLTVTEDQATMVWKK